MANTSKGIYYPDNYSVMADVPEDMREMAESIDTLFKENDTKNEQQNTNIKNNTQNITRSVKICVNPTSDFDAVESESNGE